MKKRNKIASIVLFLAALAVGFDAQPGWSKFTFLANGYIQCDIASFGGPPAVVTGMVVLQDGTVLVSDISTGLYSFKPASPGSPCPPVPPPATLLESIFVYYGMAVGLDGKIYANGRDGNVYIVSPTTGLPTSTLPLSPLVYGLGMALDPLTGDLYVTYCHPGQCPGPKIRYITGVYGSHPSIHDFPINVMGTPRFDGIAWSCDGTRLVAASQTHQVFQFARNGTTIPGFPVSVSPTPDGVAFGAEGTPFAGYFFVNNEEGTVSKIANDGSTVEQIASGGQGGDFVAVDTNGNLLLTQSAFLYTEETVVTRLSTTPPPGTPGTSGGQWALPGSSLCGDLGNYLLDSTTPFC
jgi:outer membrane protein assembly factor BamB